MFLIFPNLTTTNSRVSTLESKYVRTTRFAVIGSGTSGQITLPAQASVVLDDFGGTVDAVISQVSGGKPLTQAAVSSLGAVIATTFDSSGNFVLSDTPSSYPVAIIYRVQTQLKDFDSTSSDIWGEVDVLSSSSSSSFVTTTYSITDGQAATSLAGEVFDGTSITSVYYVAEISRGTTVFQQGDISMQYRNSSWYVTKGGFRSDNGVDAGASYTVSQAGSVGTLKLSLNSGAGNGTLKLKRISFSA